MNLVSLITGVVLAAEGFIVPMSQPTTKPSVSFADLTTQISLKESPGDVLGTGTFSATIVAGLVPTADVRKTKKPKMTIAILGDSMVDTLGRDLRLVADRLHSTYPDTTFSLLNYGVGGKNIASGLPRLTQESSYLGELRPPLISLKPDVIVIESFGYNPFPFDTGALDQHWLSMAYIINAIRTNLPQTRIVLATTIAPNSLVFGDGAPGIAFTPQEKITRTKIIRQYLENTLRFGASERIPVADVYTQSLDRNGEGNLIYINPGDHIHYSDLGRQLFSRVLVDTITANTLLEQ
ncbi:SGNH/GDSL hydrolase family protein [Candidatus Gottesmanbacteria bacterium]|nr:SGNH/GDSL hydrolase family protein [Candidatus Gottesmanbacteria bacterium]